MREGIAKLSANGGCGRHDLIGVVVARRQLVERQVGQRQSAILNGFILPLGDRATTRVVLEILLDLALTAFGSRIVGQSIRLRQATNGIVGTPPTGTCRIGIIRVLNVGVGAG